MPTRISAGVVDHPCYMIPEITNNWSDIHNQDNYWCNGLQVISRAAHLQHVRAANCDIGEVGGAAIADALIGNNHLLTLDLRWVELFCVNCTPQSNNIIIV